MAYLLREKNVPAAVVSGATREATRRRTVERFRRGELRVLCNFGDRCPPTAGGR